jgi:NADH-quinone oxidoreductase subunit M
MASLAIPGSGHFVGEFMILLGVFNTKVVISIVAFAGVVMAAVYMLRVYIRSVHNRTGPHVESRELRLTDGLVLAPLMAAIVFFALYPQFELHRAEKSVTAALGVTGPTRTVYITSQQAPIGPNGYIAGPGNP